MNQVRSRSLRTLFIVLVMAALPVLALAAEKPLARMASSISSGQEQSSLGAAPRRRRGGRHDQQRERGDADEPAAGESPS